MRRITMGTRAGGKPMELTTKERMIRAGFAAAAVLLVLGGWESYRHVQRFSAATDEQKHTYEVLRTLHGLMTRLADARTGQQSFILTGNESSLRTFREAITDTDEQLGRLQDLTGETESQQKRIRILEPLVQQEAEELRGTMDARRHEGAARADEKMAPGPRTQEMDQIRAVAEEMKNEENDLLRIRKDKVKENLAKSTMTIVEGTLVGLILLGLWFGMLESELKERRRAQAALWESEKWFSSTLGSISDAVIAADNNGAVMFMNPVAQALTGWSLAEARGKAMDLVFDVVNKETRQPVESPVKKVFREGKAASLGNHKLLIARGGREFDIEDSAAPILTETGARLGVVLVFRDITELKRTREDLEQFFTLSLDMICVAGYDGYFKNLNPAWQKILGYTREELMARPYMEFVHPDDREATQREVDKFGAGANILSFVNRYVCKDGSSKWLLWSGTLSPERQLIYAVARDITELKQIQEDLVRAKEDAEQSNRFKDQFLSTMSHELRTPLNAVLGFSDLLREESYGPLNERQKRYVNHIRTGGRHLLRLINDILDLSKIEAGRVQLAIDRVPVKSSIAEIVDALRPLADKKRQTLAQNVSGELVIRADMMRFKQMLMNLLGNAIKFTPEGGRIDVNAQKTGKFVRVEVRDNGPGISLEEQQHIFDPFYRVRKPSDAPEGTGLGLAITRRLAELQGGRLGIESQPGKGSCFHFTLAAIPYLERKETLRIESSPAPGTSPQILVVEDDFAAGQLLQSQLASAGYDPVLCRQPERAAALAAELQPAAVTLDILMKPLNGWEVLLTLKSNPRTARIPVIVISVVDQQATGSLLGADEYIVKPVDKEILAAAVENCLSRLGRMGPGRSILVVEDDSAARDFIGAVLTKHGYRVDNAADGAEARGRMAATVPDLVILDLMLPDVSGFQLLAEWRENPRTAELPVFVLTNKELTTKEKKYILLNAGAFFQKQERWQELLLRQVSRAVNPAPMECHEA